MERKFLHSSNINKLTGIIGKPVHNDMKKWAKQQSLDDYESAFMNEIETLNFINNKFTKLYSKKLSKTTGKYPKIMVDNGMGAYNSIYDYRAHDSAPPSNVMVSSNFRKKDISKRVSMHTRHYDTEEHESGLGINMETDSIQRGYASVSIASPFA
jgi:hypothetical protein